MSISPFKVEISPYSKSRKHFQLSKNQWQTLGSGISLWIACSVWNLLAGSIIKHFSFSLIMNVTILSWMFLGCAHTDEQDELDHLNWEQPPPQSMCSDMKGCRCKNILSHFREKKILFWHLGSHTTEGIAEIAQALWVQVI